MTADIPVIRRKHNTVAKNESTDCSNSFANIDSSSPAHNEFRDQLRDTLKTLLLMMLDCTDDIKVEYVIGERTTVYKIDCHKNDLGRLIGKKGQNIEGLRKITATISGKMGIRSIIEIPYYAIDKTA